MRQLLVHRGEGIEEPGGMGEPLFGPAPFVAIVLFAEVDAAAVAVAFGAGDAIGDAAALGAMAVVGMHIGDVVRTELIHETHLIRITAEDPGVLTGGEELERIRSFLIESASEYR